MTIAEAQAEVRRVFRCGFMGQFVSGLIWLASAALATWGTPRQAILCLVLGGMFIFPLTQLGLRLMGGPSSLSRGNALDGLGMQVAFTVPLSLPVIGAATLHHLHWFYPAFMIVVGAHILPFIFLYGMWEYGVMAAALLGAGFGLGAYGPHAFPAGAWTTAAAEWLFAGYALLRHRREQGAAGLPASPPR
jgi:hypothetical protein